MGELGTTRAVCLDSMGVLGEYLMCAFLVPLNQDSPGIFKAFFRIVLIGPRVLRDDEARREPLFIGTELVVSKN